MYFRYKMAEKNQTLQTQNSWGKITPYIPFVLFFLLFLSFTQRVEFLPDTDDTVHFEMLDKLGIFGWLAWRAELWQPRLFSDFFYAVFIDKLETWKLVNSIIAALLMLGVWRISFGPDFLRNTRERGRALLLAASLICLLFFFIYPNAVTSASIWYTGSFNYLWPVAALVFGLTPFVFFLRADDPYPRKVWIPISIFASICAGFNEQTTLVALGVSALILVYCFCKKRKIPLWLIIHFAVIAALAIYFMVAVLTSSRLTGGEELALFPEFATFGKRDMLQLGIHVYDSHLLRKSSLLFFVLALISGILAFVRLKERHTFFKAFAFFPAFYILLNMLPLRFLLSGTWNYYAEYDRMKEIISAFEYDPAEWFNYLQRVPPLGWGLEPHDLLLAWTGFAAVICMLFPLFFAFRDIANRIMACIIYLAAFGSGVIMGFSPTIFASGSRPFFIANILILFLCALLIKEGMSSDDIKISESFRGKTKKAWLVIAIISLVSVYSMFLYKFIFADVFYWWF